MAPFIATIAVPHKKKGQIIKASVNSDEYLGVCMYLESSYCNCIFFLSIGKSKILWCGLLNQELVDKLPVLKS
jgi:hypothetical protein